MLRIPPPEDDGFALALIKVERVCSVGHLRKEWQRAVANVKISVLALNLHAVLRGRAGIVGR